MVSGTHRTGSTTKTRSSSLNRSSPYAPRNCSGSAGGPGRVIVVPSAFAASTAAASPAACRGCIPSRPQPPSGGTRAALSTIRSRRSRTASTTPGTTRPPDEWATRMMSSTPAASMSPTTDATSSSTVIVARSVGWLARPGRSTASAGWSSRGTTRSQNRAVDPPPWTRTKVITGWPLRGGDAARVLGGQVAGRSQPPQRLFNRLARRTQRDAELGEGRLVVGGDHGGHHLGRVARQRIGQRPDAADLVEQRRRREEKRLRQRETGGADAGDVVAEVAELGPRQVAPAEHQSPWPLTRFDGGGQRGRDVAHVDEADTPFGLRPAHRASADDAFKGRVERRLVGADDATGVHDCDRRPFVLQSPKLAFGLHLRAPVFGARGGQS